MHDAAGKRVALMGGVAGEEPDQVPPRVPLICFLVALGCCSGSQHPLSVFGHVACNALLLRLSRFLVFQQFTFLHSIATDSKGNMYAAEVSFVEIGRHVNPMRE